MPTKPVAPELRFWAKVDKSGGVDACWPWIAHLAWNGYGEFRVSQHCLVKAHRYAYILLVGPVPAGLDLDHLCRNRACCNPGHLEPVSRRVNARRGECGSHRRKLTRDDIWEIRRMRGLIPGAVIARAYSVSKAHVSRLQLHG